MLIYLYDENGSPIGMKYRSQYYAEGVFDCYFFEKNLQGDIIAIYNAGGTMIGAYAYDAWGNERRNMFVDIFVLTMAFLMFFFLIRAELAMVIHDLIKKPQHRRKRTQGQSFIDWFLYRRFLDIVPKSKFILYYANMLLYFVTLIAIVLLYLFKYQANSGEILYGYFFVIAIPVIAFYHNNKNKSKSKKE